MKSGNYDDLLQCKINFNATRQLERKQNKTRYAKNDKPARLEKPSGRHFSAFSGVASMTYRRPKTGLDGLPSLLPSPYVAPYSKPVLVDGGERMNARKSCFQSMRNGGNQSTPNVGDGSGLVACFADLI